MKLGLFNREQVRRLCEISDSQLRYWEKTNVFQPEVFEGAGPYRRLYSFRDLVGLRTISMLHNKHNVALDDLRLIEKKVKKSRGSDWSKLVFYLGEDKRVYFVDEGQTVAVNPMGQRPLFKMETIARGVEESLARMRKRDQSQIGKVARNRYILQNSSFVAGTRIPTETIHRFYKAGYSPQQIVRQFPRLTTKDVKAATKHEEERLKLKKRAS